MGAGRTSPWEVAFGVDGHTFVMIVNWNENNGNLNTIRLERSANLTAYSGLLINGVNVGSPTPGGTLTLSNAALGNLGLNVITDLHTIGLA